VTMVVPDEYSRKIARNSFTPCSDREYAMKRSAFRCRAQLKLGCRPRNRCRVLDLMFRDRDVSYQ
jgi:hypothetical protein